MSVSQADDPNMEIKKLSYLYVGVALFVIFLLCLCVFSQRCFGEARHGFPCDLYSQTARWINQFKYNKVLVLRCRESSPSIESMTSKEDQTVLSNTVYFFRI